MTTVHKRKFWGQTFTRICHSNLIYVIYGYIFFNEIVMMWLQYINGNFGAKRFKEYVTLIDLCDLWLLFFKEIVMIWLQYINRNFGGKCFKEYVALISIYGYIFFYEIMMMWPQDKVKCLKSWSDCDVILLIHKT